MLGVAFAVAVMEITVAVAVGFKNEITSNLKGFVADVTITRAAQALESEGDVIEFTDSFENYIRSVLPAAEIVPVVTLNGIVKTDNDFAALALKGYEDNYKADFQKGKLVRGSWLDANTLRPIVLSESVAESLGLDIGQKVNVCFITDGRVKARPFNITGLYRTGFSDYDNVMSFVRSDDLRKVIGIEADNVTSVELRGIPLQQIDEQAALLDGALADIPIRDGRGDGYYKTETLTHQGAVFLNWLSLLDTNVVVIFILMSLVAISTLISSLFIQVLDKVNAIGLFRAIGSPDNVLSNIFVYLSLRLTAWGIVLGNLLGLGLIFIQKNFSLLKLDPEMYYVDSVPVEPTLQSIIWINIGVIAVSWLILILPARIATRLSPAKTLRFE